MNRTGVRSFTSDWKKIFLVSQRSEPGKDSVNSVNVFRFGRNFTEAGIHKISWKGGESHGECNLTAVFTGSPRRLVFDPFFKKFVKAGV